LNILLTSIAVALVLVTSILLIGSLGIRRQCPFWVGLYVFGYGQVVLVGELASLFGMMRSVSVVLALHVGLLLLAGCTWRLRGRPALLPEPVTLPRFEWALVCTYWHVLFLVMLVLGVYAIGAFLIIRVPQNNHDSMVYHLGKVGFWLQHGSMHGWDAPVAMLSATPPNSELGMWWVLLLTGNADLTGFVQWFSVLAAMPAIYGFARLWGARRSLALCAPLVWACLPENILQSTTTQNDLAVAAPFVSAVYLLCRGIPQRRQAYLLLSGLALGLAIGTKATVCFALPGLAVGCLFLLWRNRLPAFKALMQWAFWCTIGFLLLGSYVYIQNIVVHGGLFGPESLSHAHAESHASLPGRLATHLLLYGVQAFDFTGLTHSWFFTLNQHKWAIAEKLITILHLPFDQVMASAHEGLHWLTIPPVYPHEDVGWFGPVSWLVLLPAVVYALACAIRKHDTLKAPVFCAVIGFMGVQAAAMYWSPFRGRYYVLVVALCAGWLGMGLAWWFRWWWSRGVLLGLVSITAAYTVACNSAKPLCGHSAIWHRSRISLQGGISRLWEQRLAMVEAAVPPEATLGLLIYDDWHFPLFGRDLGRRIIPVRNHEEWSALRKGKQDENLYLLEKRIAQSKPAPDGWTLLTETLNWRLYYGSERPFSAWPDTARNHALAVRSVPLTAPLIRLGDRLAGSIGLAGGVQTPSWGLEMWQGNRTLWLGDGEQDGLSFRVLLCRPETILLRLTASRGARAPEGCGLRIAVDREDGTRVVHPIALGADAVMPEISLALPAGPSTIRVWSGNGAQSIGSERVMRVLLQNIELDQAPSSSTP
jgi:4-amino-4-deoxy-L-arabinose transferase-like glycosyltransferase